MHRPSFLAQAALALSASGLIAPFASAGETRISAINGEYDPGHAAMIDVRPGDTISLAADVFTTTEEGLVGEERYVEEFTWTADDEDDANPAETCDMNYSEDCLETTGFEGTDFGVNYYVPFEMGRYVTIRVSNRYEGGEDVVVLRNSSESTLPPTDIVTDPDEYAYDDFNEDYALAGQGRWVYLYGVRYWVPYGYAAGWQPYRHGYWSWTSYGWTWVSNDPWGWYTDHYGYWRHHRIYGWIWCPFADRVYRPHTVTFYYGDDYVGWYPYYSSYSHGYRHGYDHGFDDGYWDGYWDGYYAGRYDDRHQHHHGFVGVRWGDFHHPNIHGVSLAAERLLDFWSHAFSGRHYGAYIGGHDHHYSRTHVEARTGRAVVEVNVNVRSIRSVTLVRVDRAHAVPDAYRPVRGRERIERRVAVGSVVREGASGRVEVTRPTTNGRGVAVAPRQTDSTGTIREVQPRTRKPAAGNPDNPVYRPKEPASGGAHPAKPTPVKPSKPTPDKPSPAKPTPAKPSKPTPDKPSPAKPTPAKPSKPTPDKPSPAKPTPAKPAKPTPDKPSPAKPTPAKPAKPTPAKPAKPTPAKPAKPAKPSKPGKKPGKKP